MAMLLLQIVFLVKGPLYLVAISATEEPDQVIKGQLELLHAQVLLCYGFLYFIWICSLSICGSDCFAFIPCLYMQNFICCSLFYAGVNFVDVEMLVGSFDHLTCSIVNFGM